MKKDATWLWRPEHQAAFDSVKKSLASAPILMLPDDSKPFHVVCHASDFAIGCALMQFDDEGRERVVSYQSRQMKPAERNYPVHDKEPLAMRYALIKFRAYLLGEQTFAVYTDHASLRTAMKSPHLSQCMARWLSFFAEYNFLIHYKPGKNNILADVLSRRPDYDPRTVFGRQVIDDEDEEDDHCAVCIASGINLTNVSPEMDLRNEIVVAYAVYAGIVAYLRAPSDETLGALSRNTRNQIDRYYLDGDLLCYNIDKFDAPRVVVPNDDDLRARIIHEFHDSSMGAHLGREKTFAAVSRDFLWPHEYKWVRKWVRTCETCQRVKPSKSSQAPLRPLPIATEARRSVSMDFIFGLPPDAEDRTGVLVFVDRFTKMVHLIPVTRSPRPRPRRTSSTASSVIMACQSRLFLTVTRGSRPRSGPASSSFWVRSCRCRRQHIRRRMARRSESTGFSKTCFEATRRRSRVGAPSCPLLSLHLTTLSTRQRA
ncbi:hypothetical protein PF008_g26228 [Phytophthora fragariae]|uniref:Integrase zinc-binding domain-containing protein n=1 Tax=Phytophthora fragariae TaxID=53985 RepID=A0A6G0QHN7_9STRA|nr:hypothetical protein PF008_g26228 [Phytophthora fragariae]